eukprot:PhF_6_TR27186/c0_g1_i1/m.39914
MYLTYTSSVSGNLHTFYHQPARVASTISLATTTGWSNATTHPLHHTTFVMLLTSTVMAALGDGGGVWTFGVAWDAAPPLLLGAQLAIIQSLADGFPKDGAATVVILFLRSLVRFRGIE